MYVHHKDALNVCVDVWCCHCATCLISAVEVNPTADGTQHGCLCAVSTLLFGVVVVDCLLLLLVLVLVLVLVLLLVDCCCWLFVVCCLLVKCCLF